MLDETLAGLRVAFLEAGLALAELTRTMMEVSGKALPEDADELASG